MRELGLKGCPKCPITYIPKGDILDSQLAEKHDGKIGLLETNDGILATNTISMTKALLDHGNIQIRF